MPDERFDRIENLLTQLISNVGGVRADMDSLRTDMNSLRADMNGFHQEMNEFRGELNQRLDSLEGKAGLVNQRIERHNHQIADIQEILDLQD